MFCTAVVYHGAPAAG